MTLGTYPLVYLPVAAALRRTDPSMEEAAHSLGVGRVTTFRRVTLPLVRTAILGGCVLVVLTVISEYGAFEILGYQTFTTEIFTEFQFDARAAGALAIPLVLLGLRGAPGRGPAPAAHGDRLGAAAGRAPGAAEAPDRPGHARAGGAGGPRCRRPGGDDRLLDDCEPAHDAAGHGDRGDGHAGRRCPTAPPARRRRWCWRCPWR